MFEIDQIKQIKMTTKNSSKSKSSKNKETEETISETILYQGIIKYTDKKTKQSKEILTWKEDDSAERMIIIPASDKDKNYKEFVKIAEEDTESGLVDLIYAMLDEYFEEEDLKKWCKSNIVLKLKDSAPDDYILIKTIWNSENEKYIEYINSKYPNAEIINHRFD